MGNVPSRYQLAFWRRGGGGGGENSTSIDCDKFQTDGWYAVLSKQALFTLLGLLSLKSSSFDGPI